MQEDVRFRSFFLGGFECSTHRHKHGYRLDIIAATNHDQHAATDYRTLQAHGIHAVRDGLRWHLIEQTPGQYDFRSALLQVEAARATGMQVVWDLCHYGWPDDLDVFAPQFVQRYAAFAGAAAAFLAGELNDVPYYAPINEISFLAWGGGDVAVLNPYANGRGFELKAQLVRAAIAGMDAVWRVDPRARMVHADPVLHIVADRYRPHDQHAAEGHRLAQYQAWDMLAGRLWPQLGGHERYLDILGLNYYPANQWIHGGPPIGRFHLQYRWFSELLQEVYERYRRPLLIAETGAEGEERPEWLAYIGREVRLAQAAGVPVDGVCLYPVLDYPGWDDERHCRTGLLSSLPGTSERVVHGPLAHELATQQILCAPQPTLRPQAQGASQPGKLRAPQAEPPTLCLYTESTVPSGMGETMLTLAAELREQLRVALVCPSAEEGASLLRRAATLGIDTFALPLGDGQAVADVLRHWLRTHPVDIFHCHGGIGWEGLCGVQVAHGMGVPAIVRTEHLPYLLDKEADREAYRRTTPIIERIICVSEGVRASFNQAGVPSAKLRVVHRARHAPVPTSDRAAVRARLGLADTDQLVLTVGRLTEQKGYLTLLRAIEALAAEHGLERAHFVWAGVGPQEGKLRAMVQAAGLQGRVHMLGAREATADLMTAADLFVLPSRFEGLPLALREAQAAGLPAIGTRVGGIEALIEDGVTGRLVAPEQVAPLAAAIQEGLAGSPTVRGWGAAGQLRAQQQFGVTQMVAGTLAVYAEVCALPVGLLQ